MASGSKSRIENLDLILIDNRIRLEHRYDAKDIERSGC